MSIAELNVNAVDKTAAEYNVPKPPQKPNVFAYAYVTYPQLRVMLHTHNLESTCGGESGKES